jgi:hypothetical protein
MILESGFEFLSIKDARKGIAMLRKYWQYRISWMSLVNARDGGIV